MSLLTRSSAPSSPDSPPPWLAYPVLMGLWLLSHPYPGIVHDSLLYTAQALARIRPETFNRDLFFVHGSQDAFTLFSPLYAAVIKWLGVNQAAILLLLLGHIAWIAGACCLFRRIDREDAGWLGLALVFTLPAVYGGFGCLSYGEPFLTPRLFAEPLVLTSLGLLLAGSPPGAFVCLGAACLLHPLVSLTGLLVLATFLAMSDRRWLWLPLLGGSLVVALALAGMEPFNRLTLTMDDQWLSVVKERDTYVFPSSWRPADWSRLFFGLAVAVCGCQILQGATRRLLAAVTIGAVSGITLSLVGGDLLHNALIIQLQPWRAAWLLQLFANFTLALLLIRLWSSPNRRLLYCLFATAWFTIPHSFISLPLSLLAMILTRLDLKGRLPTMSPSIRLLAFALAVLAGLFDTLYTLFTMTPRWQHLWQPDFDKPAAHLLKAVPLLPALAGCLFAIFFRRERKGKGFSLAILATLMLFAAATLWDQRDHWSRFVEQNAGRATVFPTHLAGNKTLYWQDDVKSAWLLTRSASFFSVKQGAGILFTRKTALAYASRRGALQDILGPADRRRTPFLHDTPEEKGIPVTEAEMIESCGAAPNLDFVVLTTGIDGLYAEKWHAPVASRRILADHGITTGETSQDYFLYDCEALRVP